MEVELEREDGGATAELELKREDGGAAGQQASTPTETAAAGPLGRAHSPKSPGSAPGSGTRRAKREGKPVNDQSLLLDVDAVRCRSSGLG